MLNEYNKLQKDLKIKKKKLKLAEESIAKGKLGKPIILESTPNAIPSMPIFKSTPYVMPFMPISKSSLQISSLKFN